MAADKSLTHPRKAEGDEMLKEVDDDLLFLLPLELFWSREEEDEEPLWFVEHELLLEELLLSETNKI